MEERSYIRSNGSLLTSDTKSGSMDGVTLSAALTRLSYSTGIAFAFSPSLLPSHRLVDCACSGLTVQETLERLLDGTGLRYTILGDQVVVERPRPQAPDLPAKPITCQPVWHCCRK
jgi:hypothetical protein